MKSTLLGVIAGVFFLLVSAVNYPQEESSHQKTPEQQQNHLEKEDQQLLLIFSSIVTCFANILKEPYNTSVLALNLSGIATGVINMLMNTLECKRHPELAKQVKQLRAMTRTIKTTMHE